MPFATSPIVCPTCSGRLRPGARRWRCSSGHAWAVRGGVVDLAPNTGESTADAFDSPYGGFYDAGVRNPAVAGVVARALWGADLTAMYRLMDRGARVRGGGVVVDVPVGGAPVLRRATRLGSTYIGVDLSMGMLQRAATVVAERSMTTVTLLHADATTLPLAAASVDRILCFNGLHVIPDKAAVIAEFGRVLKPGGEVWGSVLTRPDEFYARVLRPWTSRVAWFFHPADKAELAAMAEASGFAAWRQTSHGALVTIRGRR